MRMIGLGIVLALSVGSCSKPTPPIVIPPTPEPIPPVHKILSRIVPSTYHFARADNILITLIGSTDFELYKYYLDGVDVLPILADRNGFNILRVFSMAQNLFVLHPQDYPTYYNRLAEFAQLLADNDFYLEFCVFADGPLVMPNFDDQKNHWGRVIASLGNSTNVIFELGNELDQPANKIDWQRFDYSGSPMLSSRGSNGSQAIPVRPAWDYETFHTNDAFEWWRKVGHNSYELYDSSKKPSWANENTRYPDRDNNLLHAYDAAAGAALLTGGSLFHSNHGRFSQLFDTDEKNAATQWIAGANSVPLFCQDGPYKHRADLEGPADLRVYQRGDDDQCIVHIRK